MSHYVLYLISVEGNCYLSEKVAEAKLGIFDC